MKLLCLLMIILIGSISAQKPKGAQRIEAMKIAFITQELSLTTNEAQQFWPIYNAYTDELKALNQNRTKRSDLDNMSEKDATKLIQESLNQDAQKLEIRRNYINQMGSTISQIKIAKLMLAEHKFKRELLKRVQKNRNKKKERN